METRTFLTFLVTLLAAGGCGPSSEMTASGPAPEVPSGPVGPTTPTPGRWLEVDSVAPVDVPYLFPVRIDVWGRNFDGVTEAWLVRENGDALAAQPMGFFRSSTHLAVITPAPVDRWSVFEHIILSEGNEPFHQADTLEIFLRFSGPVPSDTLVYEFRYPVSSRPEAAYARWKQGDFPLRVYFPPEVSPNIREALWKGVLLWKDVVAPGVPSFAQTEDLEDSHVAFAFPTEPGRGCGTSWATWNDAGELHLTRATISCGDWFLRPLDDHLIDRLRSSLRMAGHETGHALGLLEHSHRTTDAMGEVVLSELSDADIATLRALYALPEP